MAERPEALRRLRLLLAAAWVLAAPLNAGNQERFSLGDDASLKAGAVAAFTHEPSAIYYNPAGLALLHHDSVDLGVSAYAARFYRVPGLGKVQLPDQQGQLDFEGTSFFSTPAAVAFGFRLQPGLGLSLAVLTRDQLDVVGMLSQEFRGSYGGNAYLYEQGLELDFRAKNYLAGLGLGWKADEQLRLGLSIFGEYMRQSISTHFWGDYRDLTTYDPGSDLYGARTTQSFLQRVGQGNYGVRGVAGLQWDLGSGLCLGLVGRSPRFTVYQDMEVDFLLNGNASWVPVVVQVHANGDAVAHPYVWEDRWRIHAALGWQLQRLDLSAEADVADLPDDEGHGATWNLKLAVGYKLSERWDLGLGAYSDRSFDDKLESFGQGNMDYHGINGGLRWKREIGKGVELSTTLSGHYERGTGDFLGAALSATDIKFPVPSVKTNATFEEANVLLASGLRW